MSFISFTKKFHAMKKRDKELQKQKSLWSRSFDMVVLIGFFVAVSFVVLANQILLRQVDMNLAKNNIMVDNLLTQISKADIETGNRVKAFEAALDAYQRTQIKTRHTVRTFDDFIANIIFYHRDRNFAHLDSERLEENLPRRMILFYIKDSISAQPISQRIMPNDVLEPDDLIRDIRQHNEPIEN